MDPGVVTLCLIFFYQTKSIPSYTDTERQKSKSVHAFLNAFEQIHVRISTHTPTYKCMYVFPELLGPVVQKLTMSSVNVLLKL